MMTRTDAPSADFGTASAENDVRIVILLFFDQHKDDRAHDK